MKQKRIAIVGYIVLGAIMWFIVPYVTIKAICNQIAEEDFYPLGDDYYYIIDPDAYTVCYHKYHYNWLIFYEADDYEEIFPGYLKKYGADKNYLICLTKDLQSKETVYWIVTKETREAVSFRDSADFALALSEKNCTLKLDKRPRAAINYRYE